MQVHARGGRLLRAKRDEGAPLVRLSTSRHLPVPVTRSPLAPSSSSSSTRPGPGSAGPLAALGANGSSGTPSPQASRTTSEQGPDYSAVQRNLALELVRVTEAAALASGRWLGKGDKNAADQAAVDMMRKVLNSIHMEGVVVIGEGEKDEAPMLYCGEVIGAGSGGPQVDIAVDPLDGTTLTAQGRNGAVSVIAVAPRGSLFDPGPCMYMEKLAVGPEVPPHLVSLDYSVKRNLSEVARALRKPISDVTVLMLDRPRHAELIRQCREAGARIRLISDGDVGGAIEVAKAGGPVDIMMGIGGTPEGVIAACALKCMGGTLQGRLWPRNEDEAKRARERGYDLSKILHLGDLVKGDDVFFAATGVSDGDMLRGVRYFSGGASTNSIVMRCKSGTVRFVETYHRWAKPSVTNIPLEDLGAGGALPLGSTSAATSHGASMAGSIPSFPSGRSGMGIAGSGAVASTMGAPRMMSQGGPFMLGDMNNNTAM